MMTQSPEKNRKQIEFLCMDDLVPEDHLLRQIENAIDWSFIYDLVKERYSLEKGRPSIDPVTLIKIPLIQYMYGIPSMRKTIQEIEVNVAYRWFLGLTFQDPVPHFSTFGKNYVRRFEGTDLFEQIFMHILEECNRYGLVDTTNIFVDATHVKARANRNKFEDKPFEKEALFYEKQLREEIDKDREKHGKKPLKEKDNSDDDDDGPGNVTILTVAGFTKENTSKCSHILLKQLATKTDGYLVTPCLLGTSTIAELLKVFMTN